MSVQVTGLPGWDIQAIQLRREYRSRARFRGRAPGWQWNRYLSLRELERILGPDRLVRLTW